MIIHPTQDDVRALPPKRRNLLVDHELIFPPTCILAFREFTLRASDMCQVLIESHDPQTVRLWLRGLGGLDFVEDLVRPGSEEGIRMIMLPDGEEIDDVRVITTDKIIPENVDYLFRRVLSLCRSG